MKNNEAKLQASIVERVRWTVPDVEIFSIPNGLHLSKSQAALAVWTGMRKGAPDLCVVMPEGRVLWLECKTDTGRLSPDQHDLHLKFAAIGHPVIVVRSPEDVIDELRRLGIKTKEAAL